MRQVLVDFARRPPSAEAWGGNQVTLNEAEIAGRLRRGGLTAQNTHVKTTCP